MNTNYVHIVLAMMLGINSLHSLELDFAGWKEFINKEEDGTKATAYNFDQRMGDISILLTVHVHQRRSEFSTSQSITIGIGERVLADVFISYDKNGQYLKQVLVEKSEWLVSYGRFSGPGIYKEEECIVVREKTDGPKRGKEIVLIRKNGLFMLIDGKAKDSTGF